MFGDNMGALALAQNPEYHARSKHIDVQWHFVWEKIQQKLVALEYLPIEEMVTHVLTKPLEKKNSSNLSTLWVWQRLHRPNSDASCRG